MFDIHDLANAGLLLLTGWVKYIHDGLKERPTREELLLRLDNIELKIDQTKEDIAEIKDQLYDEYKG